MAVISLAIRRLMAIRAATLESLTPTPRPDERSMTNSVSCDDGVVQVSVAPISLRVSHRRLLLLRDFRNAAAFRADSIWSADSTRAVAQISVAVIRIGTELGLITTSLQKENSSHAQ